MAKAKVILFKPSGKFSTEEEWEIPTPAELDKKQRSILKPYRLGDYYPNCMMLSKDFRRVDGIGPVLVEEQEPWGFPALLIYSEGEITGKSLCPVMGCNDNPCEHRPNND